MAEAARLKLALFDDEPFLGHKACAGCGGSLAVGWRSRCWANAHSRCCRPAACQRWLPLPAAGLWLQRHHLDVRRNRIDDVRDRGGGPGTQLRDYHVVGFAGDGGTADIGLQACPAPSIGTKTSSISVTTTKPT